MPPPVFDSRDRFYRRHAPHSRRWHSFQVLFRETDLWIRAAQNLQKEGLAAVLNCRRQLHAYADQNPLFLTSFKPLPQDPFAPSIVKEMLEAAATARVGPMAAVAGAVAQHVGRVLGTLAGEVIVENGGDCYLDLKEEITVGLYAGPASPFSNQLGLRFTRDRFPLGVCTSSGTVGHSVSLGRADSVTVVSPCAAVADAAATALGNLTQSSRDISRVLERAQSMAKVEGVVVTIGDRMGAWGHVELVPLNLPLS